MELKNTGAWMQQGLAERKFDAFALWVTYGGEEATLFAPGTGPETLFDIASCGKVLVTAPLILRAVGEGLLALDDPLSRFFPTPEDKRNITVRQLLTHTSGIVRVPLPEEVAARGNDALAAYILSVPLAFVPDTKYVYSCNGYILLGFIAEKIYGAPLDVLFGRFLHGPLGYGRSGFNIPPETPDAPACYERRDAGDSHVDDENVRRMHGVAGSGASFFTLTDIRRFCQAVLEKSPLLYAPQLYDMAERDFLPEPRFEEGRGLGWTYVDRRYLQGGALFPEGSFGHCGHTGMSMFFHRRERLCAVVLTNATRFANMKNHFAGYDYNEIERMRAEIHTCIARDIRS